MTQNPLFLISILMHLKIKKLLVVVFSSLSSLLPVYTLQEHFVTLQSILKCL